MTPISTDEVVATAPLRFRWQQFGVVVAICWATGGYLIAANARPASDFRVAASWRLLRNSPGAHFDSELTVRNEGAATLSGDWSLYFNSASKLELKGASSDFNLSHINGDFYVLRAKSSAKPFAPGDHRL